MKEALVIGCGLTGGVVARELAERGWRVRIWERRNHVGGNMHDFVDGYGIRVHQYGPHTFHTKEQRLFDYVRRFGAWEPFFLKCGAEIDGRFTPTPFNFKTIDDCLPAEAAQETKERFLACFPGRATVSVTDALRSSDPTVRTWAEFLFEKDYRPYSAKQWGRHPSEISPSVLERVPLRLSYDEGYFDDACQVMPKEGYAAWFDRLLAHPGIEVELGVDAFARIRIGENGMTVDGRTCDGTVVCTGPIDELFQYRLGALPYQSLRFEWVHEDIPQKQPYPVVAYPQQEGFTRITEYKLLPKQASDGTTYALEYSEAHRPGSGTEPYYPIPTPASAVLHEEYRKLAARIPNLAVCGRLGNFKYHNMDQALSEALATVEKIVQRH